MEGHDIAVIGMATRLPGQDQLFDFDAGFFGCTDEEAAELDPQHRLFLECAYHAMEDAGQVVDGFDGLAGIYGTANLSWYLIKHVYPRQSVETLLGNAPDGLLGRVAHELNLTGPCVTVQAACSSSLVAVHLACLDLLGYQCDLVLAGGVSVTEECAGAGVVVLKRLADAHDDHVHAVIRGTAVANDGRRRAVSAAFGSGGASDAELGALTAAGIDPSLVDHVAPRTEELSQASGVLSLIDAVRSAQDLPPAADGVRRFAVTASGSGGAHAHVIAEQPPARVAEDVSPEWNLIPLSAKTPEALETIVSLVRSSIAPWRLMDVAHTLQVGRKALPYRTFAVSSDGTFDVGPMVEPDFSSVVFSFTGESVETDVLTARRLMRADVRPVAVLGKGFGEYSAACLAGVLTLEEAVELALARECPDKYAKAVANSRPLAGRLPLLSGTTGAIVTEDEVTDARYWLDMPDDACGSMPCVPAFVVDVSAVVDERTFLETVGMLWARGVDLDWSELGVEGARRVPLPGYPFERRRHYLEPVR